MLKGFMLHAPNGKSLENLNIQNKRAAVALGSQGAVPQYSMHAT